MANEERMYSWMNQGMAIIGERHTSPYRVLHPVRGCSYFSEFITILLYVTEKLSFKMEKREMRVQLVSNK